MRFAVDLCEPWKLRYPVTNSTAKIAAPDLILAIVVPSQQDLRTGAALFD